MAIAARCLLAFLVVTARASPLEDREHCLLSRQSVLHLQKERQGAAGVCTDYMQTQGCEWTREWHCPGQVGGGMGAASPNASLGYKCCCEFELWRSEDPCDEYLGTQGCEWTSEWNCQGQTGGRGFASADNSLGYQCCCKRENWRQLGSELTPVASAGQNAAPAQAAVFASSECGQFANIVVGDHDLGQAVVLLCSFWPAQYGDFPVSTTKTMVDLFSGATDLWEKIKELAKGRPGDSPMCWKRVGMRQMQSQIHLDGHLHMNATEVAMSSDCEMEALGKCYGPCPTGMKSMALVGGFAPLCSSACIQSTHEVSCGFSCATEVGTCVQTLVDQVSVVTRSVGKVASFLSGNPAFSQAVDMVLRLVEFAIDVVFDVVKVAKHLWAGWPREQVELGVVIALLQFVMEHAKTIGTDLFQLNEMFGETTEMILDLVDGEFDWADINLEFITDTILKHGNGILSAAGEFAEAFVYPFCEVVSNTNPDYDCDADEAKDCGEWDYWGLTCKNGNQCEYSHKFGDLSLDDGCRCKN